MKFRIFSAVLVTVISLLGASSAIAQSNDPVMNAGVTFGQLVFISAEEVGKTGPGTKMGNLSALSIPVFAEMPLDMTVVAGAITELQQNLLSHVQIKSVARRTPNLDLSKVPGGKQSPLMAPFKDGDWVEMRLEKGQPPVILPSTEEAALAYYESRRSNAVPLKYEETKKIFKTEELGWQDYVRVGSKAANYAELAKALNTPERTVVRPGLAIPLYYYAKFVEDNPELEALITRTLRDPLMKKVARVEYRQRKLDAIQKLIMEGDLKIDPALIRESEDGEDLITLFDNFRKANGLPRNMKLRSSTNSEDLPNFNGAGLYTSVAYKPTKGDKEKKREKKENSLREALLEVWASIWNLRAFDERNYFQIPHDQVKMAMQVNPTFGAEEADGVVVTKNIADDPRYTKPGVYIESQRGDKISVANPESGAKPMRILVQYDPAAPQNADSYEVIVLQMSNVADDNVTIMPTDNPTPVMTTAEIVDLTQLVLKAQAHFKPLLGADDPDFALDLEFKVDKQETGVRQVFLKQSRPYID